MEVEASALLVHSADEPSGSLKSALQGQAIRTDEARSCREAVEWLRGPHPPQLIFTDTLLVDGAWTDVVEAVARCRDPVNVIVVSRFVDMKAYLDALEWGAFDYLVPPFAAPDLAHVVRSALLNVRDRRNTQAAAPHALSGQTA